MIAANVQNQAARETLEKHFQKLEAISTTHDDLKEVIKRLQEENKSLKKKVDMFETEKIQIRLCVFCKDYYTPLNNSDVILFLVKSDLYNVYNQYFSHNFSFGFFHFVSIGSLIILKILSTFIHPHLQYKSYNSL